MKTLLSQCMQKKKKCRSSMVHTHKGNDNKSSAEALLRFSLVRTLTEARESPDRMLCSRKIR